MSANQAPIFPLTPNAGLPNVVLTTASTTKDGTSGATQVFLAGANGSRLKFLELHAIGTNVASLVRVFLNNGSAIGTAGNNQLIGELALPASTLSESALTGPPMILPFNREIPAGFKVYICVATAVAAGWAASLWGEDF